MIDYLNLLIVIQSSLLFNTCNVNTATLYPIEFIHLDYFSNNNPFRVRSCVPLLCFGFVFFISNFITWNTEFNLKWFPSQSLYTHLKISFVSDISINSDIPFLHSAVLTKTIVFLLSFLFSNVSEKMNEKKFVTVQLGQKNHFHLCRMPQSEKKE